MAGSFVCKRFNRKERVGCCGLVVVLLCRESHFTALTLEVEVSAILQMKLRLGEIQSLNQGHRAN